MKSLFKYLTILSIILFTSISLAQPPGHGGPIGGFPLGNFLDGDHTWIGEQTFEDIIITGGTINNTVIGNDTPVAGSFTTLRAAKNSSVTKTDNYTVTTADLGKTLVMDSASDKTFTLLSVSASDIGARLRFVKLGAGKLTIDAADSDTIGDSGAGDTVYCGDTGKAYIEIELVSATAWIIKSVVNEPSESWITTD